MSTQQLYILFLLRHYGPQTAEQIAAAVDYEPRRQLETLWRRNRIERDREARYFVRPRAWDRFCLRRAA